MTGVYRICSVLLWSTYVVMASNILVNLRDGNKIPALGYGTWQANDVELEQAVESALEAGYRHIDTAAAYDNEAVIGKVINRWITSGKVNRSDLYIVTKLPPSGNRPENVSSYIEKSLKNLQVDYLDMYLIHVPFAFMYRGDDLHPMTPEGLIDLDISTDHVAIWKEMEAQVDKGLTKSIGISNFNISQITRILNNARIPPSDLQVELHAYFQQKELVDFCKKNNIVVTAYSPLGSPGTKFSPNTQLPDILGNRVVNEIATEHNKSPAQVLLRHAVQKGLVVIPKSTTPKRIKQNIDIFDFQLDEKEMEQLNGLDQGPRGRIIDFSAFPGVQNHPEYPF